jgi:YD repeat-containing protein
MGLCSSTSHSSSAPAATNRRCSSPRPTWEAGFEREMHHHGDVRGTAHTYPIRVRVLFAFVLLTAITMCFAQPTSFRYFYDDAHRLFRVLDSTGTLIEYDYDHTGNILNIARSSVTPNILAVLNMTPLFTGPGRTITVYGQNFSPNAAGDQVTVNGVVETVLSATATTLVVQLAAGTMSGPVAVTVNGVTATSGTLQISASIPAITSVNPNNGPLSKTATVAVTGSNLTGATFTLPGGGTVLSAFATDDSDAVLQILGQNVGLWPIVAANFSGSSSSAVTAANEFYVVGPGGAYFSMTLLNQAWISADIPSPGNLAITGAYTLPASVLNQSWIPSDIPSPGNLTITGAYTLPASVLNQSWIPSDIPSPGNLAVTGAYTLPASVLNQAWIPSDIPTAGNVTVTGAYTLPVSVLNQAWISADIPSPGNIGFAAGLLVTVNNTATTGTMSALPILKSKVVASASSKAPVDLDSVKDGDVMIAGQTVRFRLYPPDRALPGADFFLNGAPLRIHAPFEVLVTAPANVSAFDLQPVMYANDGRVWRMPAKHIRIVSDPGLTLNGRANRADGSPAAGTPIGLRVNGLTAEYFQTDDGLKSWSELKRAPDKSGLVTAVNQPDNPVFGRDPSGTGLSGNYGARFRGEILSVAPGEHRFFLDAPLGARLVVDGRVLIDTPAGQVSTESQAEMTLEDGWHTIEIDSYHTASNPGIQLSWKQPNSDREVVRPDVLATEFGTCAVTDLNGTFQFENFPSILNPLEAHATPADAKIRVILNPPISEERQTKQ